MTDSKNAVDSNASTVKEEAKAQAAVMSPPELLANQRADDSLVDKLNKSAEPDLS